MGSVGQALRHVGGSAAYLAAKSRRDARDQQTHLHHLADGLALPPGLDMRWLGTSGFALSYEGHDLLIDPYVTRMSLGDLLRRRVVRADAAELDRWISGADAILVGHTHFDHALDVPAIARRTGARVYGSESARRLMGLHGLAEQAEVVEPHRVYEVGPFEITFVPSTHSKLVLGLRVPSDGPITCEHLDGLVPGAYRCDQVWGIHIAVAGFTVYHQGSADIVDDQVRHRGVDLFLCGIAGRQFSERYTERALRLLDPARIVPTHYDDMFRRLDAPMGLVFNADLTGFADEVARVSKDIEVKTLSVTGSPGRGGRAVGQKGK